MIESKDVLVVESKCELSEIHHYKNMKDDVTHDDGKPETSETNVESLNASIFKTKGERTKYATRTKRNVSLRRTIDQNT